jgi:cytochrome P450
VSDRFRQRPAPSPEALTARPDYDDFVPADLPQQWFYDEWTARRAECPVSYSPNHGGFYLLTRYEDVFDVLTDTETFTSTESAGIPAQPYVSIPEDVDPPDHRKYRKIINPPLSPQSVVKHESWIRQQAVELLEPLVGLREFDLVKDFAGPLPRSVAMKLIGLPDSDLPKVSEWTETLTYKPRDNEEAQQAGADLFAYLAEVVQDRSKGAFGEDLISLIVQSEVNGEPLAPEEMMSFIALLLFGGLHTTTHAIAATLVWLAQHPGDRDRLRQDPSLYPSAIEEAIRYTSPSSHLGRTATKDTVIGGCPIPAGSRVMASVGAASFDPEKFESPQELVLDRSPNPHAGFGLGPHRCAGSHLAKLVLRVALEEFLARFTDFEVVDLSGLRYAGAEVRGLTTVPLIITKQA